MPFKKIFYTIFFLGILFLLIPEQSHAFIGTGVFDYFDTALNGIEELTSPVDAALIKTFLLYISSYVVIFFSQEVLELVMTMTPTLLNFSANEGVVNGWTFTAGLANLVLIIIFVVVAFGNIFPNLKLINNNSLPRLLLAAALINFSFLFVGIITDFTTILYNSFFAGGGEVVLNLDMWTSFFKTSFTDITAHMLTTITASIIAYAIPVVGPFVQLAVVTTMGTIFLPTFLNMGIQIIVHFLMGGVFLIYAFLFTARVFILYLLVVLSPIAILASILPSTEKWWKMWFDTFVSWLLIGVYIVFFLLVGQAIFGLGFKDSISDNLATEVIDFGAGGFVLPDFVFFYAFLLVYLYAVLFIIKQTLPQHASEILGVAKQYTAAGVNFAKRASMNATNKYLNNPDRLERKAAAEEAGTLVSQRLGFHESLESLRSGYNKTAERPTKSYAQRAAQAKKKLADDFEIKDIGDLTDPNTLSRLIASNALGPVTNKLIDDKGADKVLSAISKLEALQKSIIGNAIQEAVMKSGNNELKEKWIAGQLTGDEQRNVDLMAPYNLKDGDVNKIIEKHVTHVNPAIIKNDNYAQKFLETIKAEDLSKRASSNSELSKNLFEYFSTPAGEASLETFKTEERAKYKAIRTNVFIAPKKP